MTFLLALFMALSKRRDDVLIFLDTGKKMRKVIDGYNLQFLDAAMAIMASVVIVAYIIYSTSAEVTERVNNEYLYLTSFFVILGVPIDITLRQENKAGFGSHGTKVTFINVAIFPFGVLRNIFLRTR